MKREFKTTARTVAMLLGIALTIGLFLAAIAGQLLQAHAGSPTLVVPITPRVAHYSQPSTGKPNSMSGTTSYFRAVITPQVAAGTQQASSGRLVSYFDATGLDLKVAYCTDQACSSSSTATIDSQGDVGQNSSITIGADGLGLISYYDATNGRLKVAHCSNTPCSSATTSTIDSASYGTTSITIGADGLGLISYYDYGYFGLKVAHCSNIECNSATTAVIDGTGGAFSSITIGADGLGLISYVPGGSVLKVAHCSNIACSFATGTIVDSSATSSSIAVGGDGLGLISYSDGDGQLKVAHCADPACSSAGTSVIESGAKIRNRSMSVTPVYETKAVHGGR
jgi:hypothetical protein